MPPPAPPPALAAPATSPRPVRPDLYRHHLTRRTEAFTSPLEPDWLLQRHLDRDLSGALARFACGRVLDVGCGGRPYERRMPAGARYVGVDVPASRASRPDCWALAEGLPFAAGSFDLVLCTQVLEHLPDPASATKELARVLRPGGVLALTAPQSWCLHEEPFDYFRFTRYGLAHLARSAGLEVVEVRRQGGFWAASGISLIMHLGSYARWAGERRGSRAAASPPARRAPAWRRLLWPLRLPMALFNLGLAALDALPQPGVFAVNHLMVARKPDGAAAVQPT
jgi:SAM-dependent methyltransferase